MDSALLQINRGNRLNQLLGLTMDDGVPYRFAKDYLFVEIPLRDFYNPAAETLQKKALKNQRLKIQPACKTAIKGSSRYLVKVNPEILAVADAPAMFILDNEGDEQPTFYATFRKDLDADRIDWCVRIYMLS